VFSLQKFVVRAILFRGIRSNSQENHYVIENIMQTIDIIQEIQQLSLTKKFYVVEETLKSIKKDEMGHQMEFAAQELYRDYVNDQELTAFTDLDFENFYEAK
jgi:hypothetical protein